MRPSRVAGCTSTRARYTLRSADLPPLADHVVDCGPGDDTALVDTADLEGGRVINCEHISLTDQVPPDPGYDGLHQITGNKLANTIKGTPRGDKIMGLAGHDWIFGAAGDDKLLGGSGNDRVFGEAGDDVLEGQEGDDHLSSVSIVNSQTGQEEKVETPAVFSFIGAAPRTDWLPPEIERDAKGFVRTGPQLANSPSWTARRSPFLLETSHPGVFAADSSVRFQYARSSGPGGQNVNKVNTKAEIWVAAAGAFSEPTF